MREIEEVIARHDSGAGACKGRAYPSRDFHHTHMHVEISVLNKPHRDSAFMAALTQDLEAAIKSHLSQPCAFSLGVAFSPSNYVTNSFTP